MARDVMELREELIIRDKALDLACQGFAFREMKYNKWKNYKINLIAKAKEEEVNLVDKALDNTCETIRQLSNVPPFERTQEIKTHYLKEAKK